MSAVLQRIDAALDFELPPELEAHEPPEASGRTRDDVRLLVSPVVPEAGKGRSTDEPIHARFTDLPQFLNAGDLVVINTSATVPASVPAQRPNGAPIELHISTQLEDGRWLVEPRTLASPASLPYDGDLDREVLHLPADATVTLIERFRTSPRLWIAELQIPDALPSYLNRFGAPIRYTYVTTPWPIDAYQNVYAGEPGSAEMPSAGRPFTESMFMRLVAAGVGIAPLVLHTGVSSLESHEAPYPEYFRVPAATARRVNETRDAGGRVVAVGTTVVRALESAVADDGRVHPADRWTELMITPDAGVRAVDGLITGWHEPQASHLLMLEAIAGRDALAAAYAAALSQRYRWHEFGDSHLILR